MSCANSPRESRQGRAIDSDAALLHARERRDHRPLQGLVDRASCARPRAAGFSTRQRRKETSASSAAYSVAGRWATRAKPIKLRCPRRRRRRRRAAHGRAIIARQLVHAMIVQPGVQRVGHQHGVVDRRDVDPVARKNQPDRISYSARSSAPRRPQQRLQPRREPRRSGSWPGDQIAAAEKVAESPERCWPSGI